jgi:hypothetical protein
VRALCAPDWWEEVREEEEDGKLKTKRKLTSTARTTRTAVVTKSFSSLELVQP